MIKKNSIPRLSRQKLYDAITDIQNKYRGFDQIRVLVFYRPGKFEVMAISEEGYLARQKGFLPHIDITYILKKQYSRYDMTEEAAIQIEQWLNGKLMDKNNGEKGKNY